MRILAGFLLAAAVLLSAGAAVGEHIVVAPRTLHDLPMAGSYVVMAAGERIALAVNDPPAANGECRTVNDASPSGGRGPTCVASSPPDGVSPPPSQAVLRGVSTVVVQVERLGLDAARCKLTQKAIENAAVSGLKMSRIRTVPAESPEGTRAPRLYINVTAVRARSECVANVQIRLDDMVEGATSRGRITDKVSVYDDGNVLIAPVEEFAEYVMRTVERNTKAFAARAAAADR